MTNYAAKVERINSDYEEVVVVNASSEEDARQTLTDEGFFVYEVWVDDDE